MSLLHTVDRHSTKSVLLPPTPGELEMLVRKFRDNHPMPAPTDPTRTPTRDTRRRFSPQEIEYRVARYSAGAAIRTLRQEYGVLRSGLRHLLLAEGVALRVQCITPEDAEEAVRLYELGLTIRQMVDRVGYSYGSTRKVLQEN